MADDKETKELDAFLRRTADFANYLEEKVWVDLPKNGLFTAKRDVKNFPSTNQAHFCWYVR
jgi:hypothetical protein